MNSDHRRLTALLICGMIVHAAAAAAVHLSSGRVDAYAFQSLDSSEYFRIGINLAEHGSFSSDPAPPLRPDTWRTPGYPLLLSALIELFGNAPIMLIVCQQAVRVSSILLLYLIARRLVDSNKAFVVAFLALVEPYGLYYSFWLMAETWFVFILLLLWLAWISAMGKGHWRQFAVCGGLAGFLVLVRPVGLLVPPVLLIALVIAAAVRARSTARRPQTQAGNMVRWSAAACFASSCAIVVGGWMLRNQIVGGHFALSNQSGVVLAYFKAAEVALWKDGRADERYIETSLDPARLDRPHKVWEAIDQRLQQDLSDVPEPARRTLQWQNIAQGNRAAADPFRVSGALSRIGRSMLLESPLATVACCTLRAFATLSFPLHLAIRPPSETSVNRVRSAVLGIVYACLAIAAGVGLVRGRWSLAYAFFALGTTVALLAATVPQLDPRFRVPMIPLLLIGAIVPTRRTGGKASAGHEARSGSTGKSDPSAP